jgi:uncharacterized OB-fold protein
MLVAAESPLQPFFGGTLNRACELIQCEGGYALLGSECNRCGWKFFGVRVVCPGCGGREWKEVLFGSSGTLYSYSTVHISSVRPVPYTIGYVDLDEGVRVLATIAGDPDKLAPDIRVDLVPVAESWAFAPVKSGAKAEHA